MPASRSGYPTAWAWDAGIVAFGATTGLLLIFGRSSGSALGAFAQIGRRVARDISLPFWGDAVLGVAIHLGEMFVLGALAALFVVTMRTQSRFRVAIVAVVAWELGALFGPFALVRPDVAANLAWAPRIVLAMFLVAALSLTPRSK